MKKPKCSFCKDTGYLRSGCVKVPCGRCNAFARQIAHIRRKNDRRIAKQ